jgi:hypothetical protein
MRPLRPSKRGSCQPFTARRSRINRAGFNVILQALPLPDADGTCKIVLRPPKDDKNEPHDRNDKAAEDERTRQAVRQSNDRRHGRTR